MLVYVINRNSSKLDVNCLFGFSDEEDGCQSSTDCFTMHVV